MNISFPNFSDDFVIPSRIEFIGRTFQLLLAIGALVSFYGLDLNPNVSKCSADKGIIYSLIALIVVS